MGITQPRPNLVKTYLSVSTNTSLDQNNAVYATGLFFAKTGNIFRDAEVVNSTLLIANELGIKEGLGKEDMCAVITATAMRATDAKVRYTLLSAVAAMTKLATAEGRKLFELSSLGDLVNSNLAGHKKNYELGLGKAEAIFLDAGAIMAGTADFISNAAKIKMGLMADPDVIVPADSEALFTPNVLEISKSEIVVPVHAERPPGMAYDFDDIDI